MVFTVDGKMTRTPVGNYGAKGEGSWKLFKDGLLHHLEGGQSALLHARNRRRQQMVGDARPEHEGCVE